MTWKDLAPQVHKSWKSHLASHLFFRESHLTILLGIVKVILLFLQRILSSVCLMRSRILGKIPGPRYVCTSQVYIFATLSLKVSYHQRECSSNCTNDCVARKKMKFLYLNTNHSPLSLTPDHDCILRNNLEGEPACVLCTHSPICVYQVKFLKRNIPIQCWSPNRACNWKDYASI